MHILCVLYNVFVQKSVKFRALPATSSVFMRRFRLFLGQCTRTYNTAAVCTLIAFIIFRTKECCNLPENLDKLCTFCQPQKHGIATLRNEMESVTSLHYIQILCQRTWPEKKKRNSKKLSFYINTVCVIFPHSSTLSVYSNLSSYFNIVCVQQFVLIFQLCLCTAICPHISTLSVFSNLSS